MNGGDQGGVLLAIGGVDASPRLVEAATQLASTAGMPLTVLHVISADTLESLRESAPEERRFNDTIVEDLVGQITQRLDAVAPEAVPSVRVRVIEGEPAVQVVEVLRSGGFGYGVVGVRSRSRVGKLVFGSTVQSILLNAPCPVLAVPLETSA